MKKKLLCVIGTRPEVIKMAPLIFNARNDPFFELTILSLGQHRDLLDQMLKTFEISPDIDLNVMKPNQGLAQLTAELSVPLDRTLEKIQPDFVLGQGDTTSTFMTSLACAYRRIPFGHIEAGLRSGNYSHPFPEEINRVLITKLTTLHFAPTESAKQYLLHEGISPETIFVTGNPVIDSLYWIVQKKIPLDTRIDTKKRLILVTLHRRENWRELSEICRAIKESVLEFEDVQVFFPVHPNPNVHTLIHQELQGTPRVILSRPLDYTHFIACMKEAYFVLSDSGGVQEEAPALGVPALIIRKYSERREAIEKGYCRLVGTDYQSIKKNTRELLETPEIRNTMVSKESPYGDGHAAERILQEVKRFFQS